MLKRLKASHSDINSIIDSGFDSVDTQSVASMKHPMEHSMEQFDVFDFNIVFDKARALNAACLF